MKKSWKKTGTLIAAILTAAVIFTACGGGNNGTTAGGSSAGSEAEVTTTTAPEKPDPIGKYTATTDFKDALNESMGGEEAPFEITGELPVDFHLELKSDDTFALEMDSEKFAQTFMDWFKENGVAVFESAFKQEGLTSEDIAGYLEIMGYDSMDAFVEEYSAAMEDDLKSSMGEMKIGGNYKIEDSKITFTTEEDGFEPKSTTLNDDGTITMELDAGDMGEMELIFKK